MVHRHFTRLARLVSAVNRDGSFTPVFLLVITPFSSTEAMLSRADLYVARRPRQDLADARDAVKKEVVADKTAHVLGCAGRPSSLQFSGCLEGRIRSAGVSASRSAAVLLRVCPVRGVFAAAALRRFCAGGVHCQTFWPSGSYRRRVSR